MVQIDGVFELERHECGAFWSVDFFFDRNLGTPGKKLIADGRTFQKRRVRAVLAQEPRRLCLQEPGIPRNAIRGQGLWGESSFSKR